MGVIRTPEQDRPNPLRPIATTAGNSWAKVATEFWSASFASATLSNGPDTGSLSVNPSGACPHAECVYPSASNATSWRCFTNWGSVRFFIRSASALGWLVWAEGPMICAAATRLCKPAQRPPFRTIARERSSFLLDLVSAAIDGNLGSSSYRASASSVVAQVVDQGANRESCESASSQEDTTDPRSVQYNRHRQPGDHDDFESRPVVSLCTLGNLLHGAP